MDHRTRKVLLIIAEAGRGKTYLARRIENMFWSKKFNTEKNYVPIYIIMNTVTNGIDMIKEFIRSKKYPQELEEEFKKDAKKDSTNFVFILDGFDEMKNMTNVIEDSGLLTDEWGKNSKIIITSRKEILNSTYLKFPSTLKLSENSYSNNYTNDVRYRSFFLPLKYTDLFNKSKELSYNSNE